MSHYFYVKQRHRNIGTFHELVLVEKGRSPGSIE